MVTSSKNSKLSNRVENYFSVSCFSLYEKVFDIKAHIFGIKYTNVFFSSMENNKICWNNLFFVKSKKLLLRLKALFLL